MRDTKKNPVRVSAAIISERDRVLVCRRRGDQEHAHKWEFPGGKIEAGESPAECLRRELAEELGIEATVGELIMHLEHEYPNGPSVELWFFAVDEYHGPMRNRVFAELRWVTLSELADVDLLEADRPVVALIQASP